MAKAQVAAVLYGMKLVGHVWNFAKAWSTLQNHNKTSQTAMLRGFSTNTSVKPLIWQCNLRFLLLSPPEQRWCEDEIHVTIWTMALGHLLRETFVFSGGVDIKRKVVVVTFWEIIRRKYPCYFCGFLITHSCSVSHYQEEKAAIKTAPVSPAGADIYCKWLFRWWLGRGQLRL